MDQPRSFEERVSRHFRPTDFVRVINIDNEDYEWDYCAEEDMMQTPTSRVVADRRIEHYVLGAGKETKLNGANAYVFMTGLIKKLIGKNETNRAAMQQPDVWEGYIERILIGTENDLLQPGAVKDESRGVIEEVKKPEINEGSFDPAELGLGDAGTATLDESGEPAFADLAQSE